MLTQVLDWLYLESPNCRTSDGILSLENMLNSGVSRSVTPGHTQASTGGSYSDNRSLQ